MIEKLSPKLITTKIIAFLVVTLLIAVFPPLSLSFLSISLITAAITIILMIYSLKQKNAGVYLLYFLGSIMLFFLWGLRFLDISIGISFYLFASLSPWILLAALFPYINFDASELLYLAQAIQSGKAILLMVTILTGIALITTFTWKNMGIINLFTNSNVFTIVGLLFYLVTLLCIHNGFHMYASGRFQHMLDQP